jgi:hypothetical protein
MPLKLIAWNPRKKSKKKTNRSGRARRNKKRRGFFRKARTPKRTPAKPARKGKEANMAKRKKGRKRGFFRRRSAGNPTPPSGRRRRRFGGGGGGGGGLSLKGLFSPGALIEGAIVGGAVAVSGIATQKIVAKIKPDLAANPWLMSGAQVVIGVVGQAALKALGLGKYAGSFMTGAVAGATLNAYGAYQASRGGGDTAQVQAQMQGLAGRLGPANSPGFVPTSPNGAYAFR